MDIKLTNREKGLADYLVYENKIGLNQLPKDCEPILSAIRKVCKPTANNIGFSQLKSQTPLSKAEWNKITKWIKQTYFIFN